MIYCDPPRKYRKRGKRWSHLFSPDLTVLKKFAKEHGLKRYDSSPFPHYDVTEDELPRLLELGVQLVDRRQIRIIMN